MTITENTLAAITDSHLFKSLDHAGRKTLIDAGTPVEFAEGQVIVREGDPGETLFIIEKGRVQISTMRDGKQVVLAKLGVGACLGEVAMITGRPRTATVVALEASTLLRLQHKTVQTVLEQNPKMRKLLESVVRSRAQDTIEKLVRGESE